jgi:hypothetical protein
MLPLLVVACLEEGDFFPTGFGAGLAERADFAIAFSGAGFFAATSFPAGRCGLTTALEPDALAAAFFGAGFFGAGFFAAFTVFLTALPGAGFFTAFAGFFTAALLDADFFVAPALAAPAFFLAELADLRLDIAIILSRGRLAGACYSPIALGGQPLQGLCRAEG